MILVTWCLQSVLDQPQVALMQQRSTQENAMLTELKQPRESLQKQRKQRSDGRGQVIVVRLVRKAPCLPQLRQEWMFIVFGIAWLLRVEVFVKDRELSRSVVDAAIVKYAFEEGLERRNATSKLLYCILPEREQFSQLSSELYLLYGGRDVCSRSLRWS